MKLYLRVYRETSCNFEIEIGTVCLRRHAIYNLRSFKLLNVYVAPLEVYYDTNVFL
jgi:hypothetical protein